MVVLSSERRAARRSLRAVEELDAESRVRLRRLLTNSNLVIVPTSSAVELVSTRLAPGSVTVGVADTEGLGIDQTVAVTEVLAGRGFDARPHLAASQVDDVRHLRRILRRLRGVSTVLLVPGGERTPALFTLRDLATAIRDEQASLRIGVAVAVATGEENARAVLVAAEEADWVSTGRTVDARRLAAWAAEMRIRGLTPPIEAGVAGVVKLEVLEREDSAIAAQVMRERRRSAWYEPTTTVCSLAQEQALDRLAITSLRIDTLNFLAETATWRQRLFDLAAPPKAV